MKESKINMNRAPLTQKELEESKNFDQLMSDFQKSSDRSHGNNNWWKYGAAMIVIIGGIGLWWLLKRESSNENTTKNEKQLVNADSTRRQVPFSSVETPFENYQLKGMDAKTFKTSTGTRIVIPENAFKTLDGEIFIGDVSLSFREYHDVPSIFASGIDMSYDSAETTYHFESAGMFEIKAVDLNSGTELTTNPDALISVELSSHRSGDHYNIYYYEPNKGWEFIEKDTVGVSEFTPADYDSLELYQALNGLKTQLKKSEKVYQKELKKAGILSPNIANNDLYSMKLIFSQEEFPELAPYSNVLFEIKESNDDFDPELAQKKWSDIELKKDLFGNYQMVLFGEKIWKIDVEPVFAKKDMDEANLTFEELFEAYTNTQSEVLGIKREKYEADFQKMKSVEDSVYTIMNMNNGSFTSELNEKKEKVTRVFRVENFGLWNSDCPQNLPKGYEVSPVFVNADNLADTITFTNLYLAELNKNALYTIWGHWGIEKIINDDGKEQSIFNTNLFSFNPKNSTVLWCVTDKGHLATIKPSELDDLTVADKGENTIIKMKLYKGIGSIQQIKESLGWN